MGKMALENKPNPIVKEQTGNSFICLPYNKEF
jgi:hypothetical protein